MGLFGGQPSLVRPFSRLVPESAIALQLPPLPVAATHCPEAQLTGLDSVQPLIVPISEQILLVEGWARPEHFLGQKLNSSPAGPAGAQPPIEQRTICKPSRSFGHVLASGQRAALLRQLPSPHCASRPTQGHTGVHLAESATAEPSAHKMAGADTVPRLGNCTGTDGGDGRARAS